MGMAGAFFELEPCNFWKLDIFLICSNDISTISWNSLWGQTYQKCLEAACPGLRKALVGTQVKPLKNYESKYNEPMDLKIPDYDPEILNPFQHKSPRDHSNITKSKGEGGWVRLNKT